MMINKQHFGWVGTDGEKEKGRERVWQCWANKTQGLFFFKHEIVSVLLKCMFEVGAQLNTSCLKKD